MIAVARYHAEGGRTLNRTFAARLNRLFDTLYPPGRGPYTSAEVLAALQATGITMSAPYLSQLRSGNRNHPSTATIEALADFFRVSPEYFTDDDYHQTLDNELILYEEAMRQLARRITGLSREARAELLRHIDGLRHEERLET
jgi:transcriptional regulator with XRE-family HTH domain